MVEKVRAFNLQYLIKSFFATEYAEYEDSGNNGDPELLFPPAIIYDPYEEAVNKMSGSTKEEEEVVDEILVTEESISTTYSPSSSSSSTCHF